MNTSRRSRRVASLVQRSLADRLVCEREYSLVTVSAVELSADLAYARVYVTCMDGNGRDAVVANLNACAARLRAQLAADLALRNVPRLHFVYDRVPERVERLERLLRHVP